MESYGNMGNIYAESVWDAEKIRKLIHNQCVIDGHIREIDGEIEDLRESIRRTNELLVSLNELVKPISHHYEAEYKEWCDRVAEEKAKAGIEVDVEVLELSARAFNALKRAGLGAVDETVARYQKDGLKNVRNLGKRSIAEIENALLEKGYIKKSELFERDDNGCKEED